MRNDLLAYNVDHKYRNAPVFNVPDNRQSYVWKERQWGGGGGGEVATSHIANKDVLLIVTVI